MPLPITSITIYTDRARITRSGPITLTPGEQIIIISDVSLSIEENSIRAGGEGDKGVKIIGVELRREYVSEGKTGDATELKRELEAMEEKERALVDTEALELGRLSFLEQLRESGADRIARGIGTGTATIDAAAALNEYLTRETEGVQSRRRETSMKLREQRRRIEALRARLNQLGSTETRQRRDIHVRLESPEAQEFNLEVVYVVTGASWSPLYDIRLHDGRIVILYMATVRQQTGEEWKDVSLVLSTSRPAVGDSIPELEPWFIDRERPDVMMTMSAPAMAPQELFRGIQRVVAMRETYPEALVESSGPSVTYHIERPATIRADGSPQRTVIGIIELDAELDHIAVPKEAQDVWLRARVRNRSEYLLLAGKASLYHEADFVGTTALETVAPGEEFELSLGVDERVGVERKLVARTTSKAMIGSTKRTEYHYEIQVKNHLPTDARVTVIDQLPLSRHESIKVKAAEFDPKPTEQSDLGELRWKLVIPSGAMQEITFGFGVEHPRDIQVEGLE